MLSYSSVDTYTAAGEIKYFDLPIPETAYGTEIVLRVETGKVGVYISGTGLPDILSNGTYQQRAFGPELYDAAGNATGTYPGVSTFVKIDTNYETLAGSKWLFIAVAGPHHPHARTHAHCTRGASPPETRCCARVLGIDDYNQFEIVSKITEFTRGVKCNGNNICMDVATRVNLQNPVENISQSTPYLDFYEYYFKAAPDAFSRIDLEVFVTVKEGCAYLYASQTERYPSPKRANGADYGYNEDKAVGACVFKGQKGFTAPTTFGSIFNIDPTDPRVLYLSVQATENDGFAPGLIPPQNEYSIAVEVYDYSVESTVVQANNQLAGGQSHQAIVIMDNFQFFEMQVSEHSTNIDVTLDVLFGEITLFIASASKPTQAVYDVKVEDHDGDGKMKYTLNFADIEMEGSFYVGLFGIAPSSSFLIDLQETRLDPDEHHYVVTQDGIENQWGYNRTVNAGGDGGSPTGEYDYIFADRRVLSVDPITNATTDITLEVMDGHIDTVETTVFEWTGPYSNEYVEANFNSRTQDVIFDLEVNGVTYGGKFYPISYLGESEWNPLSDLFDIAQEPVTFSVYGSALDPFPGKIRTYGASARPPANL